MIKKGENKEDNKLERLLHYNDENWITIPNNDWEFIKEMSVRGYVETHSENENPLWYARLTKKGKLYCNEHFKSPGIFKRLIDYLSH